MSEVEKVVSSIEKKYINELLKDGKRLDGRGPWEYRPISIEAGLIPKAEGSCDVRLGKSRVIAGVKYDVGSPFGDTPDEGVCTLMAEFVPMASPLFESGPPDESAIELARVVDRGIRHGDCINYEKLCIKQGKSVYILFDDLYIIDYTGNLIDCASIAALVALINTKLPGAQWNDEKGDAEWNGEYWVAPIEELPLTNTFVKIGDTICVDPSLEEELIADCRLSVCTNSAGLVCSMQKGGSGLFSLDEVYMCMNKAIEIGNELREQLNLWQYRKEI
ncbi:MAG TPA: exosome complex protein Rrp42 [Candidatus Lokiarchaeia archaeon]|nr:exosome complex protein Rrp42 [Candidatus Lokiarchaeia archaeon]